MRQIQSVSRNAKLDGGGLLAEFPEGAKAGCAVNNESTDRWPDGSSVESQASAEHPF